MLAVAGNCLDYHWTSPDFQREIFSKIKIFFFTFVSKTGQRNWNAPLKYESTWKGSQLLSGVHSSRHTHYVGRQLESYDDYGYKLHVVGANNALQWTYCRLCFLHECLSGMNRLWQRQVKMIDVVLQNTTHRTIIHKIVLFFPLYHFSRLSGAPRPANQCLRVE